MATQNTASLATSFGRNAFGGSPTGVVTNGMAAADAIYEFTPGSGTQMASGIVAQAGTAPTVWHSGGMGPLTAAAGNATTAITTATYVSEINIPLNCSLTGISVMIGSTGAGSVTVCLADNTGAPITAAKSASTAITATSAYQQIPFAAPYTAIGPAKYLALIQFNNATNVFQGHLLGNFTAGSLTSGTYGTFTTAAALLGAFVANYGPICDTY